MTEPRKLGHPVLPVNGVCSLCWHGDGDPRCQRCGMSVGGWDVCTCGDLRELGPCVERVLTYDEKGEPREDVLRTKTGRVVTEEDITRWAEEADNG